MNLEFLWLPGFVAVFLLLQRVGILEGFWPAVWSRLIVGRRGKTSSPLGWFFRLIIVLYILQWLLLVIQQHG